MQNKKAHMHDSRSAGFLATLFLIFSLFSSVSSGQDIWEFNSISAQGPGGNFRLPSSHNFQYLIHEGQEGTPENYDFTAFVPENGTSNTRGFLSLNHELSNGQVSLFSIEQDATKRWNLDFLRRFSGLNRPCSGCVTSWGDVLAAEESPRGRIFQITPTSQSGVFRNTLGNFAHENVAEHQSNQRTFYTGEDVRAGGHLLKFVADNPRDLSSGNPYALRMTGNSTGTWEPIRNNGEDRGRKDIASTPPAGPASRMLKSVRTTTWSISR